MKIQFAVLYLSAAGFASCQATSDCDAFKAKIAAISLPEFEQTAKQEFLDVYPLLNKNTGPTMMQVPNQPEFVSWKAWIDRTSCSSHPSLADPSDSWDTSLTDPSGPRRLIGPSSLDPVQVLGQCATSTGVAISSAVAYICGCSFLMDLATIEKVVPAFGLACLSYEIGIAGAAGMSACVISKLLETARDGGSPPPPPPPPSGEDDPEDDNCNSCTALDSSNIESMPEIWPPISNDQTVVAIQKRQLQLLDAKSMYKVNILQTNGNGQFFQARAMVSISRLGKTATVYQKFANADASINNPNARAIRAAAIMDTMKLRTCRGPPKFPNDFSLDQIAYESFKNGDLNGFIPHSVPGSKFLEFRYNTDKNMDCPQRYIVEVTGTPGNYQIINRFYTSNHYRPDSWFNIKLV